MLCFGQALVLLVVLAANINSAVGKAVRVIEGGQYFNAAPGLEKRFVGKKLLKDNWYNKNLHNGKLTKIIEENSRADPISINRKQGLDKNSGLKSGDIIDVPNLPGREKRSAVVPVTWRWPGGVLPFDIDPNMPTDIQNNITQAIQELESRTCVTFERIDHETWKTDCKAHVYISHKPGCSSNVGKVYYPDNNPPYCYNNMTLGVGCGRLGTIMHEFMHTLGFYHEHQRSDRDNFVNIATENVITGYSSNFASSVLTQEMGVPFDYVSVLMYGPCAFSNNPNCHIDAINMTMVPKYDFYGEKILQMGQRRMVSALDTYDINVLYKCMEQKIDGAFSQWTEWGGCSKTCGNGFQQRSRSCTQPSPDNGGADCEGEVLEERSCMIYACPVTTPYRYLACVVDLDETNELTFLGNFTNAENPVQSCADAAAVENGCQVFGLIANGDCYCKNALDVPDDFSISLSHECYTGDGGVISFDYYTLDMINPIQRYWGPWTVHSLCTAWCGNDGTQTRTRECDNPFVEAGDAGYLDCVGNSTETIACNRVDCPVDGAWSDWRDTSACTVTCGSGTKTQERQCDNPAPAYGGMECGDESTETQTIACSAGSCPGDGGWGLWSDWSPCSVTCDPGSQTRARVCNNPEPTPNGNLCQGDDEETQSCNDGPCVTASYKAQFEQLEAGESGELTAYGPVDFNQGLDGDRAVTLTEPILARTLDGTLCISDPSTCTNGFSVAVWIKLTAQQQENMMPNSHQVIVTSGVDADGALTEHNSHGFIIYRRYQDDMLKVIVRTSSEDYVADLPSHLLIPDVWFMISFTFSIDGGLVVYFDGIPLSNHQDGDDNTMDPHHASSAGMLFFGRAMHCNDLYFTGMLTGFKIWETELSSQSMYAVFTKDVTSIACEKCDPEATCGSGSCVCQDGFRGDGYYCIKIKTDLPQGEMLPNPLLFAAMDSMTESGVVMNGGMETRGVSENALIFNGRNDWATLGDRLGDCFCFPDNCIGGMTISYLIEYHGRGEYNNYILSSSASSHTGRTGIDQYVDGTGNLHTVVQTSGKQYSVVVPFREVYQGKWALITMTYSNLDGLRAYINGVSVGVDQAGITTSAHTECEGPLFLARAIHQLGYNGRFAMDELHLFRKNLSPKDVSNLFEYLI